MPNRTVPDKYRQSEDYSEVGSPFLWVLYFGEAKESTSPSGAKEIQSQSKKR